MRRLKRRNKFWPSQPSSAWTWRLTAPWVTPSSWAARVKLAWRAAASKARRAFNEGRRRAIRVISAHISWEDISFVTIGPPAQDEVMSIQQQQDRGGFDVRPGHANDIAQITAIYR